MTTTNIVHATAIILRPLRNWTDVVEVRFEGEDCGPQANAQLDSWRLLDLPGELGLPMRGLVNVGVQFPDTIVWFFLWLVNSGVEPATVSMAYARWVEGMGDQIKQHCHYGVDRAGDFRKFYARRVILNG